MCGRFASARKRQELLAEFQIERDRVAEPLTPDYNVAPTKAVYAVLAKGGRGADDPWEREVARELRVVRWGLVPSWAKDVSIGSRLINARAETVDSKPSFRQAFSRRRCLLPADGFYEWQQASGSSKKQPYFIHRRDGGVLAFAGLYEMWRNASYPDDHPDAWLWTATIITTAAADEVGRIHDRMPMVIDPDRWEEWLDPGNTDAVRVRPLLAPALAGGLVSYPVSTDVNSVRNNGPGLLEPLDGSPEASLGDGAPADGAGSVAHEAVPDASAVASGARVRHRVGSHAGGPGAGDPGRGSSRSRREPNGGPRAVGRWSADGVPPSAPARSAPARPAPAEQPDQRPGAPLTLF